MRKGWMGRLGVAAAVAAIAVGAGTAGCGAQRDPVVQIQVGYMKKADLVGTDAKAPTEWYLRNTVIDVRRTNPFAFPGVQDELRRIRWDIQENYLIARRAYELVSGSDGKGANASTNDGVVVAMYKISKHFDIRRAYESSTGEERNLLVENDSDRRWWEREYIRVDWSENLVSDPDFSSLWFPKIFGEVKLQPVQYYETDPNSTNKPVMDLDHGYFDITSKFVAQSETLDFGDPRDPFKFPACLLHNLFTGSETYDCNDQEVTVRTAFMRKFDHDYEPAETSGDKFSMFGTFNKDRYGFDRGYGVTDTNLHTYMARHNVWMKSHDGRTCGGVNASKLDEDAKCGSVKGSVCDLASLKCTIPYEDRTIRTVPYFLDTTMPADLESANQALLDEWNDAMKVALATTREVECRSKGGDRDGCHAKWFPGESPKVEAQVVVLCHNPARDTDDASCRQYADADGVTRVRQGDLRFNLIGWIDSALSAAPLGYGPDGSDPLTGEVVQATAYIYGASLDSYAALTRDLISISDGDLTPDAFVTGQAMQDNLGTYDPKKPMAVDHAAFAEYGQYLQGKSTSNLGAAMTDDEIAKRVSGVDPSEFVAQLGTKRTIGGDLSPAQRLSVVQQTIASKGAAGEPGFGGAAEAQARLNTLAARVKGTDSERQIVDDKQFTLENALATAGATEAQMKAAASPFGALGTMQLAQMIADHRQHLESHGQCVFGIDDFNAPNIEGLARRYRNKFDYTRDAGGIPAECKQPVDDSDGAFARAAALCRQGKVFKDLRWIIYKAVTEHEVGHTMALRHNFQGSWDSMNYHPNYWKLRTKDGAHQNKICTAVHDEKSDTCMGPRYLDPVSDEEKGLAGQPGIEEFSYSSIMDYGYDFNSDLHGIGSYDKAAMKFIYGGIVETMDGVDAKAADKLSPVLSSPLTERWMVKGASGVEPMHYTKLANLLGLYNADRCHDATAAEEADAVGGKVCTGPGKDHAFVRDMESGEVAAGYFAPYWRNAKTGQLRWPYRFGTDEYAHYPHILRFDAGADLYEGAIQLRNLYEYRYVLDYYRRGRRGWYTLFFGSRLWDRYFSRFHSLGWLAAFRTAEASAMYPDKTAADNPALNSDDWGRGYALAATVLFEGLERSALRPMPGGYFQMAPQGDFSQIVPPQDPGQVKSMYAVPDFAPSGTAAPFNVGVLNARYVDEVFDNDVGGSFYYLSYLQRMGTYVEKPFAMISMSLQFPPEHVFTRDTYLDGRNVLLNFRSVLPQAYDRLYAGMLGEDWDTIAPYVNKFTATKDPNKLVSDVTYTPLWQTDVTRPSNATLIDPLVGYKMQSATMIYSLYYGTADGSQALTNSMRLWIEGGPEGITVAPADKLIMQEPDSGVVWAAHRLGSEFIDGKPVEKGIGARMLVHANMLLALAYKVETDADGNPKYTADGHLVWQKGAAPGDVANEPARNRFKKFVGVMNVERNAMWDLGIGPLRFN